MLKALTIEQPLSLLCEASGRNGSVSSSKLTVFLHFDGRDCQGWELTGGGRPTPTDIFNHDILILFIRRLQTLNWEVTHKEIRLSLRQVSSAKKHERWDIDVPYGHTLHPIHQLATQTMIFVKELTAEKIDEHDGINLLHQAGNKPLYNCLFFSQNTTSLEPEEKLPCPKSCHKVCRAYPEKKCPDGVSLIEDLCGCGCYHCARQEGDECSALDNCEIVLHCFEGTCRGKHQHTFDFVAISQA